MKYCCVAKSTSTFSNTIRLETAATKMTQF